VRALPGLARDVTVLALALSLEPGIVPGQTSRSEEKVADLPPALIVLKNARDVKRSSGPFDPDGLSVSYNVSVAYPAPGVVEEIRMTLESAGWKPLPGKASAR
jgi:hypothetical protein